jgi:hypothetical protein
MLSEWKWRIGWLGWTRRGDKADEYADDSGEWRRLWLGLWWKAA